MVNNSKYVVVTHNGHHLLVLAFYQCDQLIKDNFSIRFALSVHLYIILYIRLPLYIMTTEGQIKTKPQGKHFVLVGIFCQQVAPSPEFKMKCTCALLH